MLCGHQGRFKGSQGDSGGTLGSFKGFQGNPGNFQRISGAFQAVPGGLRCASEALQDVRRIPGASETLQMVSGIPMMFQCDLGAFKGISGAF